MLADRNPPAREDLWVGPRARARAKREHWTRKPRVHTYVRTCVRACERDTALFFFGALAQIPGAAGIRLSHNHLIGPNWATNQGKGPAGSSLVVISNHLFFFFFFGTKCENSNEIFCCIFFFFFFFLGEIFLPKF